jgi:hypothetical protein
MTTISTVFPFLTKTLHIVAHVILQHHVRNEKGLDELRRHELTSRRRLYAWRGP